MASNAPAFESSKQDSAAISLEARQPGGPPEPATTVPRADDRAFFLRVARANNAQADLMNSSVIKLAESRELLAKVADLLRR